MDRHHRPDFMSDGDDGRHKKRRSRSGSPGARNQRRNRRRPPLPTRGRRSAGHGADRSRSRSGSRANGRRRNGSRSLRARTSRSRTRSRSRSRRRGNARSRTHSGAGYRRHSRGQRHGRAQHDSYRSRHAPPSRSRSRSFSNRSRRSARPRRGDKNGRRERKRDYEQEDHADSDDSAGHDDTIGSYDGKPGDYIASRYKIIREAGLGTFGRVLECLDKQRDMVVAIKVVRKVDKYTDSAKIEANILQDVNDKDEHNESLCVRMYKWFEYKGHVCMVFERLGCSLYEYLKNHDYQPFPLPSIRAFAWQLLTALEFIHSIKLIHTDLKPENILLVDDEEVRTASSSPSSTSSCSSPNGNHSQWSNGHDTRVQDVTMAEGDTGRLTCRPPASNAVKLIDFGGATYEDESKSSIINTRQYRSPEVILGLGWSYPSDIWSAGCIIAELYIGELLFATHENLEHLALIERSIGRLPSHMVERAASHATKFFRRGRLDWPEGATGDDSVEHVRRMRSLAQILRPEDAATGLLDLLQLMLVLDPDDRITAKEALNHQFFDGFTRQDITGYSSASTSQ